MEVAPGIIESLLSEILDLCFQKISATSTILDFSSSFKRRKKKIERIPEKPSSIEPETIEVELTETIEIPENLVSTAEELSSRKFLDTKR